MGTTLSILPTFSFDTFVWGNVVRHFRKGLSNAAKSPNADQVTAAACKKADTRNRSGILRKELSFSDETSQENDEVMVVQKPRKGRTPSKPRSSRLPTPMNKEKKASTLDNASSQDVNDNRDSAKSEVSAHVDLVNGNPSKPFYPEAWPTADMIQAHLDKRESEPTTMILARFAPRSGAPYVEIAFSVNNITGERIFNCSGEMDSLIACKEGYDIGTSEEKQIDYFIMIFKACINTLKGQVWWNGYSLVYDQTTAKKRLKITGFELEPSQLLFEFTSVKDVEVHRTSHRIELRCQSETGAEEDSKYFRVRGLNARAVKVAQLRGNLFTIHIPEYNAVDQN